MAKTARGCPRCGSHRTFSISVKSYQDCEACGYRWTTCGDPYCRGYRLHLDGTEPVIKGCPDCDKEHGGVPSAVVRWWPEAWRAVARKLDEAPERVHYNAEAALPG